MTPERFQQIEELYHAARENRAALDGADPELRREVESLLAQQEPLPEIAMPSTVTQVSVGSQLGPYKIETLLGAGGMGQVFQARDTRLGRAVALKVVHEHFNARFEREARAISALNHPYICTLHDIGPNYLVMELVKGETLAARLKKGKLSISQTLQYGAQIAEALAEAHAKGITHRDLKPANIMLTRTGVKVLDFGIAKSQEDESLTASRVAVGTPAYMAPEQREGKECDARSDIYSLGLVLHEMATGKRPPQDQPAPLEGIPEKLGHVIERCLAPDPENRWQTARDLKGELEWAAKSLPVSLPAPQRRGLIAWAAGGLGVAAALAGFLWLRPTPPQRDSVRFTFTAPADVDMTREIAKVSPDGRSVAFTARDSSGTSFVWVRSLDEQMARRIEGTDQAFNLFWSPDGQFIAFFTSNKLKKVALGGGPPQTICSTTPGQGGTWGSTGEIVFNPTNRAPLMQVSAAGGVPRQLTVLDAARQENSHRWPSFLPDGRHFLFTTRSSLKENTAIYVGSLDSKEISRILTEQSNAVYAPPGYLLFSRDGTLMAQHFDLDRLELTGEAVPITGGIDQETPSANGFFSVSLDGSTLVYSEAARPVDQLTWFDRTGVKVEPFGPLGRYVQPRISPDGKRIAFASNDPESGNRDLWLMDIGTNVRTRFTSHPANDWHPVWSPDGTQLAFASDRMPRSSLYRKAVDGSGEEELLLFPQGKGGAFVTDWSTDGRLLAYQLDNPDKRGSDIWFLPISGDNKPQPFLGTEFSQANARFSPDGKWIAYESTESGSVEVYVRAVGKPVKARISTNVGGFPVWRRDGRELFYEARGVSIMAADVQLGESIQVSTPKVLFHACSAEGSNLIFPDYDVTRDGQRFLFSCFAQGSNRRSLTVSVGWMQKVAWPRGQGGRP
jgi:Tol biopolymer transport system component